MVGTPAAETKDGKATGEARMVHSSKALKACMTMMALRGSFFLET